MNGTISSGNLRDRGLADILVRLDRTRSTGTLSVAARGFKKNIYVKDGRVIFASSTLEDDRLGEILVRTGKISLLQYNESVKLLKKTKKRQGAILVELGYRAPKELFQDVKYQVKEIIYSLFRLEEGTYEFDEKTPPPDEVITLKISTDKLIYKGVKMIESFTRVRKEFPDTDAVFVPSDKPPAISGEFNPIPEDKNILSLVDGERTLGEILEESQMNSFDVMKTLYAFRLIGLIAEKGGREERLSIEDILGGD